MTRTVIFGSLAAFVLMCAPGTASAEILEYCEGSYLSAEGYYDDLTGNDIYMRWAAAQYIGHEPGHWDKGLHQLAWVGARNASGFRELNLARVVDFDPNCAPIRGSEITVPGSVNDVNWVHRGGFVPEGHARGVWYSPHGYLVWSGAGTETLLPHLTVARFEADGVYYHPQVLRRDGILPSMASNRPFRHNQDWNWETITPIERTNIACYADWFCRIYRCPPCDSGHRLLLVYSGDLNWVNSSKDGLESYSSTEFWMGSTINYVLFRPGDNKIFHEGVLADITGIEGYDPQHDHAVYPEVVWNAGTRQWIITWEEMVLAYDFECSINPNCRGNYRYARTIDEDGNLGPVYSLGRCWDDDHATLIGKKGDDPPVLPNQRKYCKFINAGNDYHSTEGIPFSDRNPEHLSLHDSYLFEQYVEPHIPRWLASDANGYLENIYDQVFDGAPHVANISVLAWPTTEDFGYPNASYLMFRSIQNDTNDAVQNEFFLLVDQPDHAFSPTTYQGQVADQQFYYEVAGTLDYSTSLRNAWATSSSSFSFMALWSQWNQSTGKMDLMYGNYYFQPE